MLIQPHTSSPTSMYTNHPILLHSFICVVKLGILHVPPDSHPFPSKTVIHSMLALSNLQSGRFIGTLYLYFFPFPSTLQNLPHHTCAFKLHDSQTEHTYLHSCFPFPPTLQSLPHYTCAFKLHDSQTEHTYTHAFPSLINSINQAHRTCTSAKPPLIHRTNRAQHTSASASPSLIHRINQAQHTLLFPHSSSVE